MTVRDTSREAYRDLKLTGKAQSRAMTIYAWVAEHGPATRAEIAEGTKIRINAVTGRVNELIKRGLLVESAFRRECPVTGYKAHFVAQAPTASPPPVPRPDISVQERLL